MRRADLDLGDEMSCHLCARTGTQAEPLLGPAGGPLFCTFCIGSILMQLAREDQLGRLCAVIQARRGQEKRDSHAARHGRELPAGARRLRR